MNPDMILLRFGELTLKGKNRYRFEHQVVSHVQRLMKPYRGIRMTRTFGRVYLELNGAPYEEVAEQLKRVFGLYSFSPVLRSESDLEQLRIKALLAMEKHADKPLRFKVSVRRTDKSFAYDTQQLNQLIGSYVLRNMPLLKVDVHDPDVELKVEVREEGSFLFSEVVPGLKGLPAGSSGKALLLLSGGIDSPVAGWLSMRRGLRLEAVHFHSYPYTSERAQQKVRDLTKQLTRYVREIKLHMVPFTDIQLLLKERGQDNLLITLMRRSMLRIAERIAEEVEAGAIVTGDSLGQVASQTVSSMNVIGRAGQLPLLRPLISMDKEQIIGIAKQIGTYDVSVLPYEDCCTLFVPRSPSTNPNLRIIEKIEQNLPQLQEMLESAVAKREVLSVSLDKEEDLDRLF